MIVRWLFILFLLLGIAVPAFAQPVIPVLNYHDVGTLKNNYSVSPETLRRHFTLLRREGYQPISLQQYQDALAGRAALPDKPVLLTFDDGYASFYSTVYPLLQEFRYPALLSLVTSWLSTGAPADVGLIVNWAEVREMEASGLVTAASHSHNLHHFQTINPSGDTAQATASPGYTSTGYEGYSLYEQQLRADLAHSRQVLERELGHPVTALVWPYGEYTAASATAAKQAGFTQLFALDSPAIPGFYNTIPRILVYGNPDDTQFLQLVAGTRTTKAIRAAQVDIDMLDSPVPGELSANIDRTIDFLKRSRINTVFLQAFADPKGSGNIEAVYFYTQAAPVKKDIFSHIASRLKTAGFTVYAWLPTLAGQWLLTDHPEDAVQASDSTHQGWYRRATPFSPRVRSQLNFLVGDLAAYSPIDGILFQDDVYLNDFEDLSPAAQAAFQSATGQALTGAVRNTPALSAKWTALKTQTLTGLTNELAETARRYRPRLKTARNIYPSAVSTPAAVEWLAQSYPDYLQNYDYTVIMAYPSLEQAKEPLAWLEALTRQALSYPQAADKVIVKLQAYDWSKKSWVSAKTLQTQTDLVTQNGAVHLAYYPLNLFSANNDTLPSGSSLP